jgi:hypothetical protein
MPFGVAAAAHAEAPDRAGYLQCIADQSDSNGNHDDYAVQTCCVLHGGTVETDYSTGGHWCNVPAAETQGQPSAPKHVNVSDLPAIEPVNPIGPSAPTAPKGPRLAQVQLSNLTGSTLQ